MEIQLEYFNPKTGQSLEIWSGKQTEMPIVGDEFRLYYTEGAIYHAAQFRITRSERIIYESTETMHTIGNLAERVLRVEPVGASGIAYLQKKMEEQDILTPQD